MRRLPNLEFADEYLREWAFFYRDHKRRNHCKSIEHRYKRVSDDFAKEGWGDDEAAPESRPERAYRLLRAVLTHQAIMQTSKSHRWILTYAYCYPSLPKFVVLRAIKKWTGRRLTWKDFGEQLDIARMRIYTLLIANATGCDEKSLTA